jgi:hypothetical protein
MTLEGLTPNFTAFGETARDGGTHIRRITFMFGNDYQSDAHMQPFIAHFFPLDAVHRGDQTIKNSVYHFSSSQDLAATFDASCFTHSDSTPAQPGSFVWDCYGGFRGGDCDLTFENQ